MSSRKSQLNGRTCKRIGHLLIDRRYDRRAFLCSRCRKHCWSSRSKPGIYISTRPPLQERWRRVGRTWYGWIVRNKNYTKRIPTDPNAVLIINEPVFNLDKENYGQ